MRVSSFEKTMFRAAFEAEADEQRRLLEFLLWLRLENATDKILNHPLGPAKIWKEWANDTFVGFSTGKVLLQSGHRFNHAERVPALQRRFWQPRDADLEQANRQFAAIYPAYKTTGELAPLRALHAFAYLRAAEAVMLAPPVKPSRMLEIGAGNAVHVAYRHLVNPGQKTTIIDLPESMMPGFILLRTLGIDVSLPNENRDAPVTMRLPYQDIEGRFDFAFNMGSFQEMEMPTIARYFALIGELCPGGIVQNINFEKSRYIPGNEIRAYPYAGIPTFSVARFISGFRNINLPDVLSAVARA